MRPQAPFGWLCSGLESSSRTEMEAGKVFGFENRDFQDGNDLVVADPRPSLSLRITAPHRLLKGVVCRFHQLGGPCQAQASSFRSLRCEPVPGLGFAVRSIARNGGGRGAKRDNHPPVARFPLPVAIAVALVDPILRVVRPLASCSAVLHHYQRPDQSPWAETEMF